MSAAIGWRFAKRELRGGVGGFWILITCLALGVAAIAGVGTVRSAIEAGLQSEGAVLLGGDAEAEYTYRFADETEQAWLADVSLKMSEIADFRSMVVVELDGETERGLTQIKAIDTAYPLTGTVRLQSGRDLHSALDQGNAVVMEALLVDRLGLNIGDTIRLGTKEFILGDVVTNIPDSAGDGFALGPRTLVYKDALDGSGLLQAGTLFTSKYRLELPDGTDLDALRAEAEAKFTSSGMRWRDSRNGAPGVSEFVDRLASFLILVALSGLAVGGIGVSAAVRAYMVRKTSVIATLRSIGARQSVIFWTYFLQIMVLSIAGIGLGMALGAGVPWALSPMIEAALPFPLKIGVYARPLIEAFLYGSLTAVIFTLWPLAMAENIRAATLFRDGTQSAGVPSMKYLLAITALVGALVGTAVFFAGNVRLTLWAFAGVLGALVILAIAAFVIRRLAKFLTKPVRGKPKLRWSLTAISGTSEGTTSVILALGLGLSVLASVGQIDGNLRAAIQRDLPDVAPSYFFVDIQSTQIEQFQEIVNNDPDISNFEAAPMLRGVITRINDLPATEVAGDHWVVQGDRAVSYAERPSETTTITAGEWWPENYQGDPQISFSAEEGQEMGLSLGDTITMNVLGRDITGTITSFRDVDFSTAGMGFVMTMNPAALERAPHSYIATVYAKDEAEARILRELANTFPNITAIRIKDAIERVSVLLGSIAAATSYGAAATLLTGFLVLIGSAASGEHARRYEAAILKTLGATRSEILKSFALRSVLMGAGAGLVALLAGGLGGWAVMTFVMDSEFTLIWSTAFAVILGGIIANVLAGLFFALRALNSKPSAILRTRE